MIGNLYMNLMPINALWSMSSRLFTYICATCGLSRVCGNRGD
jgi:hypothetical protein